MYKNNTNRCGFSKNGIGSATEAINRKIVIKK
jgi:hypothetical protein